MGQAKENIIVMGGGAWGSALTHSLSFNNHLNLQCLVRSEDTKRALQKGHISQLPNSALTTPIHATTDAACLGKADMIYLVLPASATQDALALIADKAPANCPVILCAKGLVSAPDEAGTLQHYFLPEFMRQAAPSRPFAMLSGPSFADEVLTDLPAALVAASSHDTLSNRVNAHFAPSHLRIYSSDDVIGVAIGGAVKNVIALAAGICEGLQLGDNARAALITRGLAETARLIKVTGGKPATISGLAGIGDLMLSASGPHSRNMAYGLALGRGVPVPDSLSEGARTAPLLAQKATALGLDMPITHSVAQALAGASLRDLMTDLLARPSVKE